MHITTLQLAQICAAHGLTPASNRRDHLLAAISAAGIDLTKQPLAAVDAPSPAVPTPAPVTAEKLMTAIGNLIDSKLSAQKADFNVETARIQTRLGGDLAGLDLRVEKLIKRTDDSVVDLASSTDRRLDAQTKRLDDLNDELAARETEIKELRSHRKAGASKADIAKAVADAFAPIRAAFEAAPAEVQQRVTEAAPAQRKSIEEVFGLNIAGDCAVYGAPYGVDPDYVFDPDTLKLALHAIDSGQNVWLGGERGTGKTQFALQLAARTGRPFYRVSFDRNTERAEFIGADGLVNGSTVWQDGQVLQAYRTAGAICLLDEASAVRPDYATTLHALLEPNSSYTITSTGETVHRAPGMAFIAADNTNGCGDSTGRYAGTSVQNSALIDRFAFSFKVKFLDAAIEEKLLINRGATAKLAASLVNLLNVCRREVGSSLVEPPSLRQAFAFVLAINGGADPCFAWELAVVNKSPEESQEALRQLYAAHWA